MVFTYLLMVSLMSMATQQACIIICGIFAAIYILLEIYRPYQFVHIYNWGTYGGKG